MGNITKFRGPRRPGQDGDEILDPDASTLETLERVIEAQLAAKANYRIKCQEVGIEPSPFDDGQKERALVIRDLYKQARDYIKQGQANAAVEVAARAAYFQGELDTLFLDQDTQEALKADIRASARQQDE